MKQKGVVLGFSGGIDSATAVRLLQHSGYDVTALTLDTLGDERMLDGARSRARELGVNLVVKNIRQEFQDSIISYFAKSYLSGQTPAPCTMCNPLIKWKHLLVEANSIGAEAIATGHYFNIEQYNGRYYVARARDLKKDQSYYLWGLSQEMLSRAITPMGSEIKEEVKRHFSDKKESMGLCFLSGKSYREYMESNYPDAIRSGDIIDVEGEIVGRHDGIAFYTIGQKRGLDMNFAGGCIVAIDASRNRLVVGKDVDLYHETLEIMDCNIVDEEEFISSDDIVVIIRGIGRNPEGFVRRVEKINGGYRIHLDNPAWAPAVGQPVVFYRNNRVIGGGILSRYYNGLGK